jgi:oxygen-dependent protoporphyrinogen oxidase
VTNFLVVGGGVGGLVTARRLALAGRTVEVFEASDHLGGTVGRVTVGGLDLDSGAESFALRGGTVAALADELGLGGDIVSPNPEGAWLLPSNGRAVPLPKLSLLGVPGSPLAPDVRAILGLPGALRAWGEKFLPGTYGADAVSLGDIVQRRMGTSVLENLVAPIVRGVHSMDPHDLPLDRVAPGLRDALTRTGSLAEAVLELRSNTRAGSSVAGITGGIHRLVIELVNDLHRLGVVMHLGSHVESVEAGSIEVNGAVRTGHVIVAAPGLLGTPVTDGHLAVLTTLVLDAPELDRAPRGTGVLVAAGAVGVQARALTHATAKWSWLAERADGAHVVRLSYGSALDDHATVARTDAARILGVSLPSSAVLDFARVEWRRPPRQIHAADGISVVGETASGTGLAAVVGHAEITARDLLRDFVD